MYADWHALGDLLYRKWHVYDMEWGENMNIDEYMICGAPFGGPLAMIRDDKKLIPVGADMRAKLWIFTSAGQMLAQVLPFDDG